MLTPSNLVFPAGASPPNSRLMFHCPHGISHHMPSRYLKLSICNSESLLSQSYFPYSLDLSIPANGNAILLVAQLQNLPQWSLTLEMSVSSSLTFNLSKSVNPTGSICKNILRIWPLTTICTAATPVRAPIILSRIAKSPTNCCVCCHLDLLYSVPYAAPRIVSKQGKFWLFSSDFLTQNSTPVKHADTHVKTFALCNICIFHG